MFFLKVVPDVYQANVLFLSDRFLDTCQTFQLQVIRYSWFDQHFVSGKIGLMFHFFESMSIEIQLYRF